MRDIPTFPAAIHAEPASNAKAPGGGDSLSLPNLTVPSPHSARPRRRNSSLPFFRLFEPFILFPGQVTLMQFPNKSGEGSTAKGNKQDGRAGDPQLGVPSKDNATYPDEISCGPEQ